MNDEQQRVADLIRDAFHGVTLGNGVGLWQGQGLDDYADAKTIAAYRERDEKNDWPSISVDQLNRCHSSLCFFDAEGMRFHLPAFLLADLAGELSCGMDITLAYLEDYRINQFALLTDQQRRAVRTFLLLLEKKADEFVRPHIERALLEYWIE